MIGDVNKKSSSGTHRTISQLSNGIPDDPERTRFEHLAPGKKTYSEF
jgi:hypothetical protein